MPNSRAYVKLEYFANGRYTIRTVEFPFDDTEQGVLLKRLRFGVDGLDILNVPFMLTNFEHYNEGDEELDE